MELLLIGPIPKTVVDFWRLIWQERPPTIVMVTNLKEGNHIKCQQYWPESGGKDFGPFQVTITDEQVFADYTIRTLSVSVRT
jgi:receptor-type tyrosine-protein phosphatase A